MLVHNLNYNSHELHGVRTAQLANNTQHLLKVLLGNVVLFF